MEFVVTLFAFVLLIGILITVHEFGHFLAARMNGVFVEIFSIGFGPTCYEKTDKKGTKWRIAILPFGGYIKMFGDADVTSVKEAVRDPSEKDSGKVSVHEKKPWQRLIIAASGPLANFVLAIFVLFGFAMIRGLPLHENIINTTSEESLAYVSGLRSGDRIVQINKNSIKTFEDIASNIASSVGTDLEIVVSRARQANENQQHENSEKKISIKMYDIVDGQKVPVKTIGITPGGSPTYQKTNFTNAILQSTKVIWSMAVSNMVGISKILTRQVDSKNVGGIISIFDLVAKSAEKGIDDFLVMFVMFSVMLGAVNLLPIPVLDGGTVLLSAVECIIRRPLNKKFVNVIFMIGVAVVAFLMLLGIWNDLSKFKFFDWVENLFK